MEILIFNKPLRILLATNVFVQIAGAMLGPIYALFVKEIGGDILGASLTGGIFALTAGITTLIAGRYTDKVKEKELIVAFGYAVMGIGFFMLNFVHSLWSLFLVQGLIGFAEAFYAPAFDVLYSKHLTAKRAGREWGAWEASYYFSAAGGAAIGGIIVKLFGFHALFVIMALLCFGSAIYIWRLPRKLL